jgi:hypothetical protein
MPSMMDMLQVQLGSRLNSGVEVDDTTKAERSQMLDVSRITVNKPPIEFFAAAGPLFKSTYFSFACSKCSSPSAAHHALLVTPIFGTADFKKKIIC